EGDRDALSLGQIAHLGERVEERLAVGIARLGKEARVQHEVGQAQCLGTVEGPAEAGEAFGPGRRSAEAARLLDGLPRGVLLTGAGSMVQPTGPSCTWSISRIS